ncbi:antibiotic biosynthesis monooxygenase [Yoonia sp. SS1-5]|uniref:Quinol monooxygenase n=1 Tax=Yoonia rhodophyticola TaxID=3137370 RepID=A0AAN0MD15_9RHOB
MMNAIPLKTTPHPSDWPAHTPRPEMKGKHLGVLAHTWFQPDKVDQMGPVFRTITDIAIEEPTGLALDANVSLQDPLHNMMYEEWEDYDEFFAVQLTRPYRMAFLRWLIPVMSAPISAEFYEIIGRAGRFASGDQGGTGTLVLSIKLDAAVDAKARDQATDYLSTINADPDCCAATAMVSLNDPAHLVVVERWKTADAFAAGPSANATRDAFASGFGPSSAISAETYQVHYNPGRFEMPS